MSIPLPRSLRQPSRASNLFLGLTRFLLAAVVFLTPLFFLPGLTDSVEGPKGVLVVGLTLAAAVTLVLKWMTDGQVEWRKIPLGWPLTALVVTLVLSSIFSVQRTISLVGSPGYVHHTLPVVMALIIWVVLAVQVFEVERDLHGLAVTLLASLALSGLSGLLQIAGVSPFPDEALRSPQFLISGNTMTGLAVLMSTVMIFGVVFMGQARQKVWRLLVAASLAVAAIVMLSIDQTAAWMALVVGMLVVLITASLRPLSRIELSLGAAGLVIAILGLLLPTSTWFGSSVTPEAHLDSSTSWQITSSTLKAYPIIGTGPTTFYYDFVRYRPAEFNSSPLASLNFLKGADEATMLLTTLGLLGAAAVLAIVVMLCWRFVRLAENSVKKLGPNWSLAAASFGAFCGLLAADIFIPASMATETVSAVIFGIILLILMDAKRQTRMGNAAARITTTLAFLVSIGILVFTTTWSVRMILADRGLVNIAAAINRTENLENVIRRIDRVIRLTPYSSTPYVLRAQTRLVQVQLQGTDDQAQVANLLAAVVADGQIAVARDPKNPVLLTNLAAIYKSVGNVVGNTGLQVIQTYEQAVALDPNNASYHVNLGQAYYLMASALSSSDQPDQQQDEIASRTNAARAEFETALRLQPRYQDAQFGLILVDELIGEKDRALTALIQLTTSNPTMGGLWYELGLRYADRKDTPRAKAAFEQAVRLAPDFANAHYQLGLLAEQAKDTATAISEYTLTVQLDSNNTDAQKRFDELSKKK